MTIVKINAITVPADSGDELAHRFSEIVEPLWRTLQALTSQAANLRTTRDLLLPRLISGELSVADLDIAVPEAAA